MCRILVIEDDKIIQSNLFDLLTSEEYNVLCADNGKEGVTKVYEFFPDLIICDIMMPELNGFEVLEKLQEDEKTAGIPFLFLTAKTDMDNLRYGMKLGADDYLIKPFQVDDILDAIKTRLRKRDVNNKLLIDMQNQIAHKIPHDLRTPLVPILGYADMIEEEDDLEQIRMMIKTIKNSGKVLHNRIEKFLLYKDLIMYEIKKPDDMINILPIEITKDIILYIYNNIKEDIRGTERIKVDIENARLKINQHYFSLALIELIENALRYSQSSSSAQVTGKNENDLYEITIRDTGIGMSQNQINSITAFNKFSVDSIPEPGLGLGLAVVQKLISLHEGTFSITSKPEKFTECKIVLPLV